MRPFFLSLERSSKPTCSSSAALTLGPHSSPRPSQPSATSASSMASPSTCSRRRSGSRRSSRCGSRARTWPSRCQHSTACPSSPTMSYRVRPSLTVSSRRAGTDARLVDSAPHPPRHPLPLLVDRSCARRPVPRSSRHPRPLRRLGNPLACIGCHRLRNHRQARARALGRRGTRVARRVDGAAARWLAVGPGQARGVAQGEPGGRARHGLLLSASSILPLFALPSRLGCCPRPVLAMSAHPCAYSARPEPTVLAVLARARTRTTRRRPDLVRLEQHVPAPRS